MTYRAQKLLGILDSLVVYLTLQQLTTSIKLLFGEITYEESKRRDKKGILLVVSYIVVHIIA